MSERCPTAEWCSRSDVIKIEFRRTSAKLSTNSAALNLPVVLQLGYRTLATFQNGFHVGLSVNLR